MRIAGRLKDLFDTRTAGHPSWVILIELFIGLGWIRAATEKIINRDWWGGGVIEDFIADHQDLTLGWFGPVLDEVISPNVSGVAVVVVIAQLVAGLSLLSGKNLIIGLTTGITMNITFVIIGAVDPSIFYLILQVVLTLWLFENSADPGIAISMRWLSIFIGFGIILFFVSAPYVTTLDPQGVVEDPATVLCTYGISVAVSSFVAWTRLKERADVLSG